MSEQGNRQEGVAGDTDHPQHRAGPGEGVRAPLLADGGDAAEATRLVEQLAESSRTVGIVYAGPPEGLPPAEDALAASGIPAILCYGDLYGARLLSPHVFQNSPSYLWEARRIADYLIGDRGYTRVGLVSEADLYQRC